MLKIQLRDVLVVLNDLRGNACESLETRLSPRITAVSSERAIAAHK